MNGRIHTFEYTGSNLFKTQSYKLLLKLLQSLINGTDLNLAKLSRAEWQNLSNTNENFGPVWYFFFGRVDVDSKSHS